MKSFALLLALALLSFTGPAFAAETSEAPPELTLEQQVEGPIAWLEMGPSAIKPFCWTVQGTTCTSVGSTRPCTDSCNNNLSCTCTYYYSNPTFLWWNCDWEC